MNKSNGFRGQTVPEAQCRSMARRAEHPAHGPWLRFWVSFHGDTLTAMRVTKAHPAGQSLVHASHVPFAWSQSRPVTLSRAPGNHKH